ncbi:hypothetical protein MTR67_041769, partial [Solanum verrucosum]
ASVGKLLWQIVVCKESLWVKWVHGVYIKTGNFWDHKAPADSSWYWRKLNSLKTKMQHWYTQGQLNLTANGDW